MQPLIQALKELGSFLGRKLDELIAVSRQQKISLDIGDATSQLESAAKNLTELSQTLQKNEATRNFTDVRRELSSVARTIADAATALRTSAQTDYTKEFKQTHQLLKSATEAIRAIKLKERDIDLSKLSDIEEALKTLISLTSSRDTSALERKIDQLIEAFSNFSVNVPSTVSINPRQVKVLATAAASGGRGQQIATQASVTNVSMASADTQYSHTFSANTTSFYMKLRSQNTKFFYSWESGKLPGAGDGSAYMTTGQNFLQSRPGLEISGKTIYFETATTSQVMEIEEYTM